MADSENKKLIGMVIDCAKLTPEIFAKALEEMIKNISNKQPQGKTSLNKLMKTGKVENIAVNDSNIGTFGQTAKKYDLTYALKRTQGEGGNKQYLICFHAKDLDTLQKAFKEYTYNQMHKKETLFSKKKVAEIDISAPNKDVEIGREKNKERKKERSERDR